MEIEEGPTHLQNLQNYLFLHLRKTRMSPSNIETTMIYLNLQAEDVMRRVQGRNECNETRTIRRRIPMRPEPQAQINLLLLRLGTKADFLPKM